MDAGEIRKMKTEGTRADLNILREICAQLAESNELNRHIVTLWEKIDERGQAKPIPVNYQPPRGFQRPVIR